MRIVLSVTAALAGLFALSWPLSDMFAPAPLGPWMLYQTLFMATGVIATGLMAVAMVLALRLPLLDRLLGGLDRCYQVHRRAGEMAVGFAVAHYLLRLGARELRDMGLLEKVRGLGLRGVEVLDPLRHTAEDLGEYALYAFCGLVAVALLRMIPYHWFAKVHRVLAALFLVIVFHSVVLLPGKMWLTPLGLTMAVLLAAGTVAAVQSLRGTIGTARRARGTVIRTRRLDGDMLEVEVALDTRWRGHRAGQFAFLTFDDHEGHHPFTIASAWGEDRRARFVIKALGDHTRDLVRGLQTGESVQVEGPYGGFDFADGPHRQIWVAGGVGITPFIARLEDLAAQGGTDAPIDLFVSLSDDQPELCARLKELCARAGVTLHVTVTSRDTLLTVEALTARVPDWQSAGLWFCGPAGFGRALRAGFARKGLRAGRFHQEAFEFR